MKPGPESHDLDKGEGRGLLGQTASTGPGGGNRENGDLTTGHRGAVDHGGTRALEVLLGEIRTRAAGGPAESRRLFHGRGGCFPGLEFVSVDWFSPVAQIVLHGDGVDSWLGELAEGLRDLLGDRLACLLVQRRHLPGAPTEIVYGAVPDPAFAREAGLTYRLRLGTAQNIGFFPDMAQGRALVRRLAPGRRVLNLFAYTCSFSVAALAGGADHVVNLDMNRGALDLGRANHRDNGLDLRRASFLPHNLFKSFGALRRLGPFDVAVVDPPTDQGPSFRAPRDWPRVVRRLPSLVRPGGEVVACLNAPHLPPEFLIDLFAEHLPQASLLACLGSPDDFPERIPARGLKILHFHLGE